MSIVSIILIAVSLSVDSFAASMVCGLKENKIKAFYLLKVPFILSIFQTLFILFGWLCGYYLKEIITDYDHWLAFFILLAIGFKMIWESLRGKEKQVSKLSIIFLCGLGVATSIDAAAVGISLSLLAVSVYLLLMIIFLTTFFISCLGLISGKKFSRRFGRIEILGAVVLILIGCKILLEHLFK